jgi:hypothetical protein
MADTCLSGICNPRRTQGRVARPSGRVNLLVLQGPGLFVGASVAKQGGDTDITSVILDIDGRNVVNLTYAAARNFGLTQPNPFGLVLHQTQAIDNVTIGYPSPLRFERELVLAVDVNEPNVVQVTANVIHGTP